MDISDEALEKSLDYLIEEEADFLDIETEEMLLEENFDSNNLNKNKISKDQTLKKKIKNSETKQNFVVQSQTNNTKKTTKQENSNVKADSAKQNSEKRRSFRKRNRNCKWFSPGNKYRRHQNNFEQDHNITSTNYNHFEHCNSNFEQDHNITTTNYNHNKRISFGNFLTNSLANNSCISSSNMYKMNCENNINTWPNFLSNFENNQGNLLMNQQSFNKSNELINLIRCPSRENVFSSSNMRRMNMETNCVNNLNTRPNFLSNFENNYGNFMMDQQLFNKSNEFKNLIRCSMRANMEAINRSNIYKMEFITLIAAKLFDLIDLIQTTI